MDWKQVAEVAATTADIKIYRDTKPEYCDGRQEGCRGPGDSYFIKYIHVAVYDRVIVSYV